MHSLLWRPFGRLLIIVGTQSANASNTIQDPPGLKGSVEKHAIHVAGLSQLSITRIPRFAVQYAQRRGETQTRACDPHRRVGGERCVEGLNRRGRSAQRMPGAF